mgnify:CR=1 FL=1
MQTFIREEIAETYAVLETLYKSEEIQHTIIQISHSCSQALASKNKILFIGNGGSAADAQHLASELMGRLRYRRPGVAALALTADTSVLTAISNDYGFENLFSHQVEALGHANDVLIAISTSGQSLNILKALEVARNKKLIVIGLTGLNGHKMEAYCDYILKIPSTNTQKIQECHIILGHIICSLIENQVCCKGIFEGVLAIDAQ